MGADESQLQKALTDAERFAGLPLGIMKRRTKGRSNDTDLRYTGWAAPLSLTSEAVWFIVRETVSTGDIDHVSNVGINFTQIWDDRESLIYK